MQRGYLSTRRISFGKSRRTCALLYSFAEDSIICTTGLSGMEIRQPGVMSFLYYKDCFDLIEL